LGDPQDSASPLRGFVRVNLPEKPTYAIIDEWQKIYGANPKLIVTFKDESQEW
jgi:hypothetical protein